MQAANLQTAVALGWIMHDLQLTEGERVLAKDALWWRLFSRLHPSVRKDMVGWMGLVQPAAVESSEANEDRDDDALSSYVRGAAQALNPLPSSEPAHCQSDRAALAADAIAVGADLTEVVFVASKLAEAVARGWTNERRRKERPDAAE